MRKLYIFVGSDRPDQYLNPIVHSIKNLDVREIIFLHIQELAGEESLLPSPAGRSARVLASMHAQLKALAERGEYLSHMPNQIDHYIPLHQEYDQYDFELMKKYYRSCRDISVSYSNIEIKYDNIRHILRRVQNKPISDLVDVTAIRKIYLGDIIAACLVEGVKGLYTFDVRKTVIDFSKPWRILIHELDHDDEKKFRYVNIIDTDIYKSCIRLVAMRSPRVKWCTMAALLAIALGISVYWYAGPDSSVTQTIMMACAIASLVSILLSFFPPRR